MKGLSTAAKMCNETARICVGPVFDREVVPGASSRAASFVNRLRRERFKLIVMLPTVSTIHPKFCF